MKPTCLAESKNQNFVVEGIQSKKIFLATPYKAPSGFFYLISLDSDVNNRTERDSTVFDPSEYRILKVGSSITIDI